MGYVSTFVSDIAQVYKTGSATEHSYRPALHKLLGSIADNINPLNEPKRVACGAPDFIVRRGSVTIGHLEAKDVGVDLHALTGANAEQQKRYLGALPNLIYTNGTDWDFFRKGELVVSLSIAEVDKTIKARPERFEELENLLKNFVLHRPQAITSPRTLAEIMAGKAVLIKDVLFKALSADSEGQTDLARQYGAFHEHLIKDISKGDFADIYAETIAYGMFAARLHDTTLGNFSRQEALELLPRSNPFLRSLFGYIAGQDLDERISWIVDDLAEVFQVADIGKILDGFGRLTAKQDPFLHFYETFLAAYNPEKRKARGVWYTPEPVVGFIVRAVDEVLQKVFELPDGLADTSKVTIDWETGQNDKKGRRLKTKKDVHRVQILDPATGTGTFLAEVIKRIVPKVKAVGQGVWGSYIERDLIPRLHGFELLMASYAMCHTKLDMILSELGYVPTGTSPRLSVYLTNSLEEGEPANQTLPFAQWLSNEAKAANAVKRDMPIMCVIGNPPYNPSSKNNSKWILSELKEYKKGLNERKINLGDDYIKFIRFSEVLIERNEGGVIAMITNNSYLDGVTQRAMRLHLRETFDAIYVLNLHGDIRNEAAGAGDDENVFDITQGVAIVVMYTKGPINRKILAPVFYTSVSGRRADKYRFLESSSIYANEFQEVKVEPPNHRFVPSAGRLGSRYEAGFKVTDLFQVYSSGIQTKRDPVCVAESAEGLRARLEDFKTLSEAEIRSKYSLPADGRDWTISGAKADVLSGGEIVPFLYKPFDRRLVYYSGRTKGFVSYPRREVMQHIVNRENVALIVNRQTVREYFSFVHVTDIACCHGTFYLGNRGQDYCMPLYVYPNEGGIDDARRVNFEPKLFAKLQKAANNADHQIATELDVFDYVYGVLHCPDYRATYAGQLREDFPRIPWPQSSDEFWQVCEKGRELRRLHLGKPGAGGASAYPLNGAGNAVVDGPRFEDKKMWINGTQYFYGVPESVWEFFVGGYRPAEKWLKDRKGQTLSYADVRHYQWMLRVLSETDRVMRCITMRL